MRTLAAAVLLVALLTPTPATAVGCAAYTPECGYPDAPAMSAIIPPDLPLKCWRKKYRKDHKHKCRHYTYWKTIPGARPS